MRPLFLVLFLLTSCEVDFGKKIKKFVDNDIHNLSTDLAKSSFTKKSFESNFASISEMSLLINGLINEIRRVPVSDEELQKIMDYSTSLNAYEHYEKIENKLYHLNIDMDDLVQIEKNSSKLCQQLSKDISLEKIRDHEVLNITKMEKQNTVYFNLNLYETVIVNVTNLLTQEKFNEQVDIANKAIKQIPKKLVTETELKEIFSEKCESIQVKVHNDLELSKLRELILKTQNVLGKKIEIVKTFKMATLKFLRLYNHKRIYEEFGLTQVLYKQKVLKNMDEKISKYDDFFRKIYKSLKKSKNIEELNDIYDSGLKVSQQAKNYIESMKDFTENSYLLNRSIDQSLIIMKIIYRKIRKDLEGK